MQGAIKWIFLNENNNRCVRCWKLVVRGLLWVAILGLIYFKLLQYLSVFKGENAKYFLIVYIGIPTLICLWFFYTSDVRRQMRGAIKWFFLNEDSNGHVRYWKLVVSGVFGLVILTYIYFQLSQEQSELKGEIAKYFFTALISISTLICLWSFRTSDVRQQINHVHFNQAIENLTNISLLSANINLPNEQNSQQSLNDMIKEAIGVQSLIKLSEITPDFHELITIMFKNKKEEFTKYDFVHNESRATSRKKLITDMDEWLNAPPKHRRMRW